MWCKKLIAVSLMNALLAFSFFSRGLSCFPHAPEERVTVSFRVKVPNSAEVHEVFLAGNSNELGSWNPRGVRLQKLEMGVFVGDIDFALGQKLEFKVTRGDWSSVEKSKTGLEIPNRTYTVSKEETLEIVVERWASTLKPPSTVVGELRTHFVSSISPSRWVRVLLPTSYSVSDRRFPVLYMLDGQNVFDRNTSALGMEWGIDETLAEFTAKGPSSHMIVVAIDNSAERIDEYTPIEHELQARRRGGKSERFLRWVVQTLKPEIDRHYRTRTDRESTWIGGSSLGALCALHALAEYNEQFSGAIAMSPSVRWGGEAEFRTWLGEQIPKVTLESKLWLDFGTMEGPTLEDSSRLLDCFKRSSNVCRQLIETASLPLKLSVKEFQGAKHDEAAWGKRFREALEFISN